MSYGTVAKYLVGLSLITGASTSGQAGQDAPSLKSLKDDAHERIYVLVPDGVDVFEARAPRRVAHIELPGWVWAGEPYSCPPDMTFSPTGDILVTSNVVPVVWRIERRTLATSVHELAPDQDRDKDIGFIELRWSGGLGAYVATTDGGARWHVDRALSVARKMSDRGAGDALPACGG
jgi:hypothetical protein